MSFNHNFTSIVVNGNVVAGACSKCGLTRSDVLAGNHGAFQGCEVGDSGKSLFISPNFHSNFYSIFM